MSDFYWVGDKNDHCESSSRSARTRRMELRRVRRGPGRCWLCDNSYSDHNCGHYEAQDIEWPPIMNDNMLPKFGISSVCGRRREMEDTVAIHPLFYYRQHEIAQGLHYFGVYDGHGCSHVATKCRERLHQLVKEELVDVEERSRNSNEWWKWVMDRCFSRMDKEVVLWNQNDNHHHHPNTSACRCESQTPERGAVGSTAVVAVITPTKIVVANCGDSRAVLCRNSNAIPLSTDHKPDRPDELSRILGAGGRVVYWQGARVFGVLAMSRAIGDNYLKPYVSCEPEVTITERSEEDECLILASDGLWDVVNNETACGVARVCLRGLGAAHQSSYQACSDASVLLTKLALARMSADNVSVVVVDLGDDESHFKLVA